MKRSILFAILSISISCVAGTITFGPAVDNQDGTCTIPWAADVPIVAMALDVDATDDIVAVAVDSFFDIFMDVAYDEEAGDGYTYGEDNGNGCICDQDAAGSLALPQSNFCISMGGLGGEEEPLDDPCLSGTIVLTADGYAEGYISENALRGGVIDENGAQVTTNLPIAFVICGDCGDDCMQILGVDTDYPAVYAAYLAASAYFGEGAVDCWCDEYNCQGDGDGSFASIDVDGKRKWVTLADLNVLSSGWGKKESQMPAVTPPPICGDADRNFAGSDVDGKRKWVTLPDLNILSTSWGKKESQMPTGPHQVPCHGYE